MLKCCKEQCPYILHDEQTVQEIKKGCKNKKQIPLDFVTTCIKQQAGVDIMNRVRLVLSLLLVVLEPLLQPDAYPVNVIVQFRRRHATQFVHYIDVVGRASLLQYSLEDFAVYIVF
jgi:hypothetical protein